MATQTAAQKAAAEKAKALLDAKKAAGTVGKSTPAVVAPVVAKPVAAPVAQTTAQKAAAAIASVKAPVVAPAVVTKPVVAAPVAAPKATAPSSSGFAAQVITMGPDGKQYTDSSMKTVYNPPVSTNPNVAAVQAQIDAKMAANNAKWGSYGAWPAAEKASYNQLMNQKSGIEGGTIKTYTPVAVTTPGYAPVATETSNTPAGNRALQAAQQAGTAPKTPQQIAQAGDAANAEKKRLADEAAAAATAQETVQNLNPQLYFLGKITKTTNDNGGALWNQFQNYIKDGNEVAAAWKAMEDLNSRGMTPKDLPETYDAIYKMISSDWWSQNWKKMQGIKTVDQFNDWVLNANIAAEFKGYPDIIRSMDVVYGQLNKNRKPFDPENPSGALQTPEEIALANKQAAEQQRLNEAGLMPSDQPMPFEEYQNQLAKDKLAEFVSANPAMAGKTPGEQYRAMEADATAKRQAFAALIDTAAKGGMMSESTSLFDIPTDFGSATDLENWINNEAQKSLDAANKVPVRGTDSASISDTITKLLKDNQGGPDYLPAVQAALQYPEGKTVVLDQIKELLGQTTSLDQVQNAANKKTDLSGIRNAAGQTTDLSGIRNAAGQTTSLAGVQDAANQQTDLSNLRNAAGQPVSLAEVQAAANQQTDLSNLRNAAGQPVSLAEVQAAANQQTDLSGLQVNTTGSAELENIKQVLALPEAADIKAQLEQMLPDSSKPVAPSFKALYDQTREQYGLPNLETRSADLQTQIDNLKNELFLYGQGEDQSKVAKGVIAGRVSEAERIYNQRLFPLTVQLDLVTRQIDSANKVITNLVELTGKDFEAQRASYNDTFAQNMQRVTLQNTLTQNSFDNFMSIYNAGQTAKNTQFSQAATAAGLQMQQQGQQFNQQSQLAGLGMQQQAQQFSQARDVTALDLQQQAQQFGQAASLADLGLKQQAQVFSQAATTAGLDLQQQAQIFGQAAQLANLGMQQQGQAFNQAATTADLGLKQQAQVFSQAATTAGLDLQQQAQIFGQAAQLANLGMQQNQQQFSQARDVAGLDLQQQNLDLSRQGQQFNQAATTAELGMKQQGQQFDQAATAAGLDLQQQNLDLSRANQNFDQLYKTATLQANKKTDEANIALQKAQLAFHVSESEKNNAKANLLTLQQQMTDGSVDYSSLGSAQQQLIKDLEKKAGYPQGLTQYISATSGNKEWQGATTFTDANGNEYVVAQMFDKATGEPSVEKILLGQGQKIGTAANGFALSDSLTGAQKLADGSYVFGTALAGRTQCGEYVNDTLRLTGTDRMGDTLASKMDTPGFTDIIQGGQPVAGGYFVENTGINGHVGIINKVTADGIYITDSNYDGQGGMRSNQFIPKGSAEWKKIVGFGTKQSTQKTEVLPLADRAALVNGLRGILGGEPKQDDIDQASTLITEKGMSVNQAITYLEQAIDEQIGGKVPSQSSGYQYYGGFTPATQSQKTTGQGGDEYFY